MTKNLEIINYFRIWNSEILEPIRYITCILMLCVQIHAASCKLVKEEFTLQVGKIAIDYIHENVIKRLSYYRVYI